MCWFLLSDIFVVATDILISACIYFYTLMFLYSLHLDFSHHNYFLHIDIFLSLTLVSSCFDFYTMTFFYYLHLHLFRHVLHFTHWHIYITYTCTFFMMYWFLNIDIFLLLKLILITLCIDCYTLTFSYYLHL